MYYIEVRKQIQRKHDPQLVSIDDIGGVDGSEYPFRSVYAYTEETAEKIHAQRSTAGLQSVYKYSDKLFIDIDGGDKDVQQAGDKLCDLGIGFEYWTTGNRGGHFHVPVDIMAGFNVSNQQKAWVQDNVSETADCSIYTCNGQIRMPGAVHSKTGKPKKLLEKIPGTLLSIADIAVPTRRVDKWHGHSDIDNYVDNLTRYCGPGQRHLMLMIIVKDGIKLGFSLDKILEDCYNYNMLWVHPPLSDEDVIKHVTKTWHQYGGE